MLSFTFAGKNSFNDFGIKIAKRPSITSPKRRVTSVTIPGRSSSIRFDENSYDDITLTVECSILEKNLPDKIDEIKGWFLQAGENDLVFNFQPNKKYKAQVVNSIDFSQIFKYTSKFIIVFNCQPFKYAVNNEVITLTEHKIINNIGSIYSEPIIKIFGFGDVVLNIDEQIIRIKEIQEHIILDSVTQDSYNEVLDNLNNKVSGEFPILKVGENQISWTGSISKIEIIPNWRWI